MITGSNCSNSGEGGPDGVTSVLDLLLEEIETECDRAKHVGSDAFHDDDHDREGDRLG